jgi:hypothetical protein
MRAAYMKFLEDVFRKPEVEDDFETRDWWSELKHISRPEHPDDTTNTEILSSDPDKYPKINQQKENSLTSGQTGTRISWDEI